MAIVRSRSAFPKRNSHGSPSRWQAISARLVRAVFIYAREFRVETPENFEVGQKLSIDDVLKIGDVVDVQGISKGKGFQGVMKRHGFKGGGASHGSGFARAPGSIGCSAWPARVVKGKKMPGRMGNDTVLKKNMVVIDVRSEDNVVLLKGSVPGAKNGLLKIFSR